MPSPSSPLQNEFSLFSDDDLPEDDFDSQKAMTQLRPWPKGIWFVNVDEDDDQ